MTEQDTVSHAHGRHSPKRIALTTAGMLLLLAVALCIHFWDQRTLDRSELDRELHALDSYAAELRLLVDQYSADHVTSSYAKTHSEYLTKQCLSFYGTLGHEEVGPAEEARVKAVAGVALDLALVAKQVRETPRDPGRLAEVGARIDQVRQHIQEQQRG